MRKYVVMFHGEVSGLSFTYEVEARSKSQAIGFAARRGLEDGDFDLDFDPPELDACFEDV